MKWPKFLTREIVRKIEIEKSRFEESLQETPEIREAILSLVYHPGFKFLTTRLRFQRAVLEDELKSSKHVDIRAVDRLQNGIAWLNWLEAQVLRVVEQESRKSKELSTEEQDLFSMIQSSIEKVK